MRVAFLVTFPRARALCRECATLWYTRYSKQYTRYTALGGWLVTLRVTHLVYLVPVTKISTRTAVRIAGTTFFTTRRCDTKAGERTPPQTRNATPHNFCAIFGLYLSCIARAFGDCQ